jgi:hypothetical protein
VAACAFVTFGVRAAESSEEQLYESAYAVCHPARGTCAKFVQQAAARPSANATIAAYVPRVQIDSEPPYSACHPARGPCAKGAPPTTSSGTGK